jgi:peptide deformylase
LVHERLEGHSRAGNFGAVIFQHEYDHLQGTLFIDKPCTNR